MWFPPKGERYQHGGGDALGDGPTSPDPAVPASSHPGAPSPGDGLEDLLTRRPGDQSPKLTSQVLTPLRKAAYFS